MSSRKLVLASASPRRRDLLSRLGVDFEVLVSDVDEDAVRAPSPAALTMALARAKAEVVAAKRPAAVVIAADTIVVHEGVILGKPRDAGEARQTLVRLRGKEHEVITGVTLILPEHAARTEIASSRVHMQRYADEEIDAWIERGGAFDKAGGYAIQDDVFQPVASYEGCYCNIMGLPLWLSLGMLAEAGIEAHASGLPAVCRDCPGAPQAKGK